MPPLVSLTTNLKSLKYGNDRPYGGSSNQPYITTPIPPQNSDSLNLDSPDDLLRGGLLAPLSAAADVSRLTKMFSDTKSPEGLLFIAKQNLLSRISVKTEASRGAGYLGGVLNQGAYTPLSTLAQAGAGFLGTHVNLFGLDPTNFTSIISDDFGGLFPNFGINSYEKTVKHNNENDNNRLINLLNTKVNLTQPDTSGQTLSSLIFGGGYNPTILSYGGGPGSELGIGSTNIYFAEGQRTGKASSTLSPNNGNSFFSSEPFGYYDYSIFTNPNHVILQGSRIFNSRTLSVQYSAIFGTNLLNGNDFKTNNDDGGLQKFQTSVYLSGSLTNDPTLKGNTGVYTYTQKNIIDQTALRGQGLQADVKNFVKDVINSNSSISVSQYSRVLSNALDYSKYNIEQRVFLGDPGKGNNNQPGGPKNVFSYAIKASTLTALDKINAMPMYEGTGPRTDLAINDLVKFSIAVLDNDKTDNSAVYMHFRAFINSFSDSYGSTWNPVNYAGRGEPLYGFGGNFTRRINMSFIVAAQSKAELIPMYKKLNYLASSLAPDYNSGGYMRGNLVRMSLGGYLFEQYGIIESLTYEIPSESTWEIGITDDINVTGATYDVSGFEDRSVKELPHMIKVTGLSFIPINSFLTRKAIDPNNADERFIALSADGTKGNYNDVYPLYNKN